MIPLNLSIIQSGGVMNYPITVKLTLLFRTVRLPNQKSVYFSERLD